MARRIGSAILLGIVAITLAGIPFGSSLARSFLFLPHPSGTFLKLDCVPPQASASANSSSSFSSSISSTT